METIIGIDLGTNEQRGRRHIEAGRPDRAGPRTGDPILRRSSVLDPQGKLLIGRAARNQYALSPDAHDRSISAKWGRTLPFRFGNQNYARRKSRHDPPRAQAARGNGYSGGP